MFDSAVLNYFWFYWQRGRVVSALDLKSVDPRFKFRSDH